MSIEKITARILQEARDEAAELTAKAEAERTSLLRAAEDEAGALTLALQQKAVTDAGVLKERRQSVAELEARKELLAAKQEVIEEAFTEAEKTLSGMDAAAYKDFLLAQLSPYRDQVGEILLNERDKKNLSRELGLALADSPLAISEETADIQGGFILSQGCVSVNASIEKLLEQERKEITAQIAEVLFS